jgi:predicted nucleic acid-binding protein
VRIFVLDANAVIRFLSSGPDAERVAALVHRVALGQARLLISVVNRVEVLYTLAKRKGFDQAREDLRILGASVESVPIDEMLAEEAALVRFNYRLGLGDCFAAALALRTNATLVTSDPDFGKLGKRVRILALSRHNE